MTLILISGCSLLNDTSSEKTVVHVEELNEKFTDISNDKGELQFEKVIFSEDMLSKEKINNLYLLGKIWGFLKYYHPNVANGEFDWDEELVKIMPSILQTESSKEKDRLLSNWIISLGNFKTVKSKSKTPKDTKMAPQLEWISHSNLEQELVSLLTDIKNAKKN